jgi:predicted amidohydrolase
MSGGHFRVAAVQTVSGGDVEANLRTIEPLVIDAAGRGARLVLLPELRHSGRGRRQMPRAKPWDGRSRHFVAARSGLGV